MEEKAYIEIRITGPKDKPELTPENYDIRDVIALLKNVEDLFYSEDKSERPVITYRVEGGSVRNIFSMPIYNVNRFNDIIGIVSDTQSTDLLSDKTAEAFESIQKEAIKNDYTYSFRTSLEKSKEIKLDKTTNIRKSKPLLADVELYFYGTIIKAGGKDDSTIHILTNDYGIVKIDTPKEFLEERKENLLYKVFGIRTKGKQFIPSGKIDKSNIKFVELLEYSPVYDEEYLRVRQERATKKWSKIKDVDKWLRELRGYDD